MSWTKKDCALSKNTKQLRNLTNRAHTRVPHQQNAIVQCKKIPTEIKSNSNINSLNFGAFGRGTKGSSNPRFNFIPGFPNHERSTCGWEVHHQILQGFTVICRGVIPRCRVHQFYRVPYPMRHGSCTKLISSTAMDLFLQSSQASVSNCCVRC